MIVNIVGQGCAICSARAESGSGAQVVWPAEKSRCKVSITVFKGWCQSFIGGQWVV